MKTFNLATVAIAVFAMFSIVSSPATAQIAYKSGARSQMTLAGTSTLHDWTMVAKSFNTNASITVSPDNQITGISSLILTLPVTNLKSEKDGLNENAWETLEYEDHKNITFKMTSAKVTPAGGNKFQITAVGNLTIAGNTKPVTLQSNAVLNADGSLTCTGSLPIKLSQFNIERPSFMFGTMSVGDAMTLSYNVVLVK
jgi:polyisoprenoid-binding protein YceI